jgi:hypothetical protein
MKVTISERFRRLRPIHYLLLFLALVLYIGIIVGIVNYRNNRVVTPPRLDIVTPVEGDTYSSENVLAQGQTDPKLTVTVLDQKVKADKDGKFSVQIPLKLGQNSFKFSVKKDDLTTEETVNIVRVAPEPAVVPPVKVTSSNELNNTGPESFWLLEAALLAASGAAYQTTRRRQGAKA